MGTFALYLLKSVIWLTGFALIYFLFLRNERFFRLKRYYLIAGILISFIFPLFGFHYQVEIAPPEMISREIISPDPANLSAFHPVLNDKPFDARNIFLFIYLSGIIFLAFRTVKNTVALLKTINRTRINYHDKMKLVRTPEFSESFSFFNYVFINSSADESEQDVIIGHELVHVNQKHWIDLLLVELLRWLQWINPVVWIYTRFIKENHEYIADELALQKTVDPAVYKAVLVNQLFDSRVISLSNSFNYSLNKKRFDMMKTMITSPYRKMKILLVLPLFAIVFYAFATPEYSYISDSKKITEDSLALGSFQKEAKGVVVNEAGKPLSGVNVIVTNSAMSVLTDGNGKFAILRIPEGSSLIFSYKGFKTYILPPLITSNTSLYVKLVKDPDYKGKVEVRSSDGSQVKALIVVDGVISGRAIDAIDPNSILSMNVLKDEAATDKYGEKGNDGVIEITTKKTNTEAQATNQKTVKGIVLKEDGQPLERVDITSTGTAGNAYAATTGKDGRFEINNVQSDASLLFYCRGYKPLIVKPDFNKEMSIKLEKDPNYKEVITQEIRTKVLIVVDDVITESRPAGDQIASVKFLKDKEATDKYGEKGKDGVMEFMTLTRAKELGIKVPFRRRNPEDFPTFQGQRFTSFTDWVASHVKYPPEAQAKQIEGWVQMNFTVEPDGTISNVKSTGITDPLLSEVVLKVVQSSPKWEPAKNPEAKEPFTTGFQLKFKLPDQILREEPFVVVEEMPVYPGGEPELLRFIAENTRYPEAAKAEKIEGKVIIRFVVNTEGNTEGISVLKGVHPLLDAEAGRVVSLLSGFKPGMQNGKAVPVWYMVPVSFLLEN